MRQSQVLNELPARGFSTYIFLCNFVLFSYSGELRLDLVDVGIDGSDGDDVHDVAHVGAEVDEVDGLVQTHLDRADDLSVGAEHLEHLVGGAGGGEVGEYQRVHLLALHLRERILLVAQLVVEGES